MLQICFYYHIGHISFYSETFRRFCCTHHVNHVFFFQKTCRLFVFVYYFARKQHIQSLCFCHSQSCNHQRVADLVLSTTTVETDSNLIRLKNFTEVGLLFRIYDRCSIRVKHLRPSPHQNRVRVQQLMADKSTQCMSGRVCCG